MAIVQAMCTSFKKELMEAKHNFLASGGDTFRIALYTSSASLGAATPAYTTSGETSGQGYTAKGEVLTNICFPFSKSRFKWCMIFGVYCSSLTILVLFSFLLEGSI